MASNHDGIEKKYLNPREFGSIFILRIEISDKMPLEIDIHKTLNTRMASAMIPNSGLLDFVIQATKEIFSPASARNNINNIAAKLIKKMNEITFFHNGFGLVSIYFLTKYKSHCLTTKFKARSRS